MLVGVGDDLGDGQQHVEDPRTGDVLGGHRPDQALAERVDVAVHRDEPQNGVITFG
ncbi:hypothetical protein [Geodermatophilus sabuli]|uniref:hypothetical protein n=1 Tax=Geodermatophilus sabuli TaxID=1564158 RepID=UPI001559B1B4|nr:hypothetical protein [Geodermatophilus sabuli]MBB3084002.1 hypothetical protein [Geodermatophilus sabuli]